MSKHKSRSYACKGKSYQSGIPTGAQPKRGPVVLASIESTGALHSDENGKRIPSTPYKPRTWDEIAAVLPSKPTAEQTR
jgi:hypothetical protein